MTVADGRRVSKVDVAMVQLVRLVLADDWNASGAADELRRRVPSDTVLRCLRSKVTAASADRASDLGQRALATLDLALSRDTLDWESLARGPVVADGAAP